MQDKKLHDLITSLALPDEYIDYISYYFQPLVEKIQQLSRHKKTPVIGINGSQGSGKTTAAVVLQHLLENQHGRCVSIVSIDDFYHTKKVREKLAATIHPLMVTRGVPGTHDVELALQTIQSLQTAMGDERIAIPRFDKALDDRKAKSAWDIQPAPPDLIIFEGWCVGAPPMNEPSLLTPMNELEANEDRECIWRHAVNDFLRNSYQRLFARIDCLLMLKAPSFDVVYEWRLLQEQKLAQSVDLAQSQLLNEPQLQRFIQHYQRLTEHCLETIPARADAIIGLDKNHRMVSLQMKSEYE